MSRAGEFFSLYNSTVTTSLDTDPIDISISHSKKYAIAFAVILFRAKSN